MGALPTHARAGGRRRAAHPSPPRAQHLAASRAPAPSRTHPSRAPPRLAIKIRAARVNRDRAIQQQQNAEIKARQAEYDAAFNEYVQQSEAAATAQEAQAQAYRRAQACKAREVLEEQMLERQVGGGRRLGGGGRACAQAGGWAGMQGIEERRRAAPAARSHEPRTWWRAPHAHADVLRVLCPRLRRTC